VEESRGERGGGGREVEVECKRAWSRVPPVCAVPGDAVWLTELMNKEGADCLRSNDAQDRSSYKGERKIIEARVSACEGVRRSDDGVE
jgi:hypothetical protein